MNQPETPLVLITHPIPRDWIARLFETCQVITGPSGIQGLSPELEEKLPDASGLISLLDDPVDAALLEKASSLRVISNMAVGVDNIDLATCTEMGIPVGNTPGVLTEGTADLTMALLLAVGRRLYQANADAKAGLWSTWDPAGWLGADLAGSTLGILGMGKIGTAVARRAAAFDCEIIFTNRSPKPALENELPARQVPLEKLLEDSDFLCLHVPLTEETDRLIDEEALQKMKQSAILINAARGAVIDTGALVKALQEGWIRAAGLDVTDPEPLPPEHILYSLENCLITPHIGSATWNTRQKMADLAVENILAGLAGEPLPHCANPEVYADEG